MPATYTFTASDGGAHDFTVTLKTVGAETIKATDQQNSVLTATTAAINVAPGVFGQAATLLASSYYDSAVYEFDAGTGALKTTLVAPYTSPLLSGPAGMTQGPDGNLYISSQFNDTIVRINLTTNVATTFLTANDLHPFVTATGNNVFFPSGLQFGPDGNLYVCLFGGQGSTTGGVVRFNIASNSGNLSYAGSGTLFGSGLSQPTALLFGAAGDASSMYVSNAGADDVVKITNATSATPITTTFLAPGSGGVNYPAGLAWGPDQKFYVTDLGATSFQGNVLQFNADGSFTKVMTPGGPVGNLFGQFPSSVLFDGQGHFFTANLGTYPPNLQGSINEYNNDGSFAQTLVSSSQFPNTGQGTSGIAPSQFTLLPTPPAVTHFVISAPSSTSITAGRTVNFTIMAEDGNNNVVPGYTGTVQLGSTDGGATYNGVSLPTSYTFTATDAGADNFTVALTTAGTQTIKATDQQNLTLTATTSPITVNPGAFSKYVVNILGSSNITAGNSFIFTVQATDVYGNTVASYNGPTSVTTALNHADPLVSFPATLGLNSAGFGFNLGTLKTAGTYTIIAANGNFSGASGAATVAAAGASYFGVVPTGSPVTGTPFNLTVTAYDKFGNQATGYTGTVKLTSSDPAAGLGVPYAFTTGAGHDNGSHTFSVTLNTAGSQTITATDTVATTPTITGISNAIVTRGLLVTGFTPTPTGFIATFNKPFMPADLTLYSSSPNGVANITMFGSNSVGAIHGTLLIDPSNQSITFKTTATYLSLLNSVHGNIDSVILPDATYTVKLISGSGINGFLDALGAGLDGANNGGHANFITTFATHYQQNSTPVLGIPDFARAR